MRETEAAEIVRNLFECSYSAFVRYAVRRAGTAEFAEDLVQDALLDLYRALCKGTSVDQPKLWTFVVLQRKIYKELRRHYSEVSFETLEMLEASPASRAPVQAEFGPGEMSRFLALLSPREHEVVLLRLESLKYREIAKSLNISKSAVNTLIARALRKFKAAAGIAERELGDPKYVGGNASQTLQ